MTATCKKTDELPGIPKKRGRPSTGKAMSNAERQKLFRNRTKFDRNQVTVNIMLSALAHHNLGLIARHEDMSVASVIEKMVASYDKFLTSKMSEEEFNYYIRNK